MRKLLLILMIMSIFSSCVTPPGTRGEMMTLGVTQRQDAHTGAGITKLVLPAWDFGSSAETSIGFKHVKSPEGTGIGMFSYFYGYSWLFVQKLSYNIDGKFYKFITYDSNTNVATGGYVSELNNYKVDVKFIEKLANAKKVSVRLHGRKGNIDLKYKPEFTAKVKEFYSIIK